MATDLTGQLILRKISVEKRATHANKETTLAISKRGEFVFSSASATKLIITPGDKIDFYCDSKNAQKIFFNISSSGEYVLKKTKDRQYRFTNKNLKNKLISFLTLDLDSSYRFKILEHIKIDQVFYNQIELIKSNNKS